MLLHRPQKKKLAAKKKKAATKAIKVVAKTKKLKTLKLQPKENKKLAAKKTSPAAIKKVMRLQPLLYQPLQQLPQLQQTNK
jgi:hypothetical protein